MLHAGLQIVRAARGLAGGTPSGAAAPAPIT